MRQTILSLLFCTLPFTAMAAESVDSSNANSGVNSNEKGVEKITIEGAATANNEPVGTFNSPISNLEYDPRVDLQSRNMAEAQADAEAIRLRGEAEADAIKAKGLAEAETMSRKADAWKEYGQAALVEQLFNTLPEVANAVAQPLAKTEKIVIISTGGGDDAGAGASKVTRDVTNTIAQLPDLVEALTGIDIISTIQNLPGMISTHGADDQQNGAADDVDSE